VGFWGDWALPTNIPITPTNTSETNTINVKTVRLSLLTLVLLFIILFPPFQDICKPFELVLIPIILHFALARIGQKVDFFSDKRLALRGSFAASND
jgi:hypothetical protein